MSGHLHQLKKVNENSDGILEVCIECKARITTKKDPKTGRVDNKKYLKDHMRDTLQPNGRTSKLFKKYYPNAEVL